MSGKRRANELVRSEMCKLIAIINYGFIFKLPLFNNNLCIHYKDDMLLRYILSALLFFVSTVSNAGMKVSDYQLEKNTSEITIYLKGVINGFAFANTELNDRKENVLYCPPKDQVIEIETYIQLLDEKIRSYPKEVVGNLEIEPLLLNKLIETYPCKWEYVSL